MRQKLRKARARDCIWFDRLRMHERGDLFGKPRVGIHSFIHYMCDGELFTDTLILFLYLYRHKRASSI